MVGKPLQEILKDLPLKMASPLPGRNVRARFTHQGATYQSLGWSLREWRRASPGSQKGRGSKNTKRERWTRGMGANVAPQGSPGILGGAHHRPRGTSVPSAWYVQAGEARSAGAALRLCSVSQKEQAGTQQWGGPLLNSAALASRTFTVSAASSTDLPTLPISATPEKEVDHVKTRSARFYSTFTSYQAVSSMKLRGFDGVRT